MDNHIGSTTNDLQMAHHIFSIGMNNVSNASSYSLVVGHQNYNDGTGNILIGSNIICRGNNNIIIKNNHVHQGDNAKIIEDDILPDTILLFLEQQKIQMEYQTLLLQQDVKQDV